MATIHDIIRSMRNDGARAAQAKAGYSVGSRRSRDEKFLDAHPGHGAGDAGADAPKWMGRTASDRATQASEHAKNASNNAFGVSEVKSKSADAFNHATASHAHASAALAHAVAARESTGAQKSFHVAKAEEHHSIAQQHDISAAGGDWDEGKHPRDENGKFGG